MELSAISAIHVTPPGQRPRPSPFGPPGWPAQGGLPFPWPLDWPALGGFPGVSLVRQTAPGQDALDVHLAGLGRRQHLVTDLLVALAQTGPGEVPNETAAAGAVVERIEKLHEHAVIDLPVGPGDHATREGAFAVHRVGNGLSRGVVTDGEGHGLG